MKQKIIVYGSLAYDRIMDFPGYFSDHIIPEKIHNLNVCFQVNGLQEKFGGTAGNIAYALTLLGERPIIAANIGRDYARYFAWLKQNKISTENIRIIEKDLTAGAYITTDRADNQITGFHPGAMKYPVVFDFTTLEPEKTLVIVSPGNIEDMLNFSSQCRSKGIDFIFDPGQSLPLWDGDKLAEAIRGCRILISNDYELELIKSKTGLKLSDLLRLAGSIIATRGELGSQVCTPEGELDIPAVKPRKVIDPTGAGDSFRGGLIAGLVQDLTLEECARMGSTCASFCVESYGTQEYRFSLQEFRLRLDSCIYHPHI